MEQQYGQGQYKNLSEDEKQRLVEYRKIFNKIRKNKTASKINSYQFY